MPTQTQDSVALFRRLDELPFSRFHIILLMLVFIAVAFDNMDVVTLSFVIPLYSAEWGLSPNITRLHPIVGIGGTMVGAVIFGMLADRIGRVNAFIWGVAAGLAATAALDVYARRGLEVTLVCARKRSGKGSRPPDRERR